MSIQFLFINHKEMHLLCIGNCMISRSKNFGRFNYVFLLFGWRVAFDDVLPLGEAIKKGRYQLRDHVAYYAEAFVDTVTQRKVYGWHGSSDCDHCHVEYPIEFKNRKAFYEFSVDMWDGAEGNQSLYRITKAQYLECKNERVERDYVMEAHEDGHPYNVQG
jgi:hypothetical protein